MLAEYLSSSRSGTLKHLLLLVYPAVEPLLLLVILVSGLNKVDFYHMIYLVIFVCYLVFPKRSRGFTTFLVVYSFMFIIFKHIYTMMPQDLVTQHEDFLKAIGVQTDFSFPQAWGLFEYKFFPQQWIILVSSYLQSFVGELQMRCKEIDICYIRSENTLKTRYPKTNTIFQKVWILKRNIQLLVIFAIFYILITAMERSLVFWGF